VENDDQLSKINDLAKQPIHQFVRFCSSLSQVLKLFSMIQLSCLSIKLT